MRTTARPATIRRQGRTGQRNEVVKSYRADAPDAPIAFRRGDIADAEPAVADWRMPVDEMFQ